MKPLLIIALAFLSLTIVHAAELEVRVLQLSGEQALPTEIIRLSEVGILPSTASFTTSIGREGAFSHAATKPVTYATSFDNAGNPVATENRGAGLFFSGRATTAGDVYSVAFEFSTTALQSVRMYRNDSGALFPQPIFQSRTTKSSVELLTDSWAVMPILTPKDDSQTVLLVRICK